MARLAKHLVLIATALALTGCKLAVMVSSGGYVESSSGTRDCTGPDYCEFVITDPAFSETFTAVPRPGYSFVGWQDGNGFICTNEGGTSCTVAMPNETIGAAVVALFSTASIRPVFSDPGGIDTDGDGTIDTLDLDDDNDGREDEFDNCPLDGPDVWDGCPTIVEAAEVIVGTRNWVQPDWFDDISWHDVNATCPAATGLCSGEIAGVDVTGWTWATSAEVTDLINSFMGTSLGAVPDWIEIPGWTTVNPFVFNYFHSISDDPETVYGWTRDEANIMQAYRYGMRCGASNDPDCFALRAGAAEMGNPIDKAATYTGVWLYRIP